MKCLAQCSSLSNLTVMISLVTVSKGLDYWLTDFLGNNSGRTEAAEIEQW